MVRARDYLGVSIITVLENLVLLKSSLRQFIFFFNLSRVKPMDMNF